MSVIVTVRATLRAKASQIQKLHDEVTGATKEMALAAGDLGHRVFLGADGRSFLGIDEWKSVEDFQRFSSQPQIREFFGQMFEGEPEVRVWTEAGWNAW